VNSSFQMVSRLVSTARGASHAVRCTAQVDASEPGVEVASSRTVLWGHPLYGGMATDDGEPWNFWNAAGARQAAVIRYVATTPQSTQAQSHQNLLAGTTLLWPSSLGVATYLIRGAQVRHARAWEQ
jgi:hypothetical protein